MNQRRGWPPFLCFYPLVMNAWKGSLGLCNQKEQEASERKQAERNKRSDSGCTYMYNVGEIEKGETYVCRTVQAAHCVD